ncbi:MAG: hypothetical protein ABJA02_08120 [Acidobacteriota bacterium]
MKKAVYFSLALILFGLASAENAFACSCVASPDPAETQIRAAFSNSEAIFSGKVVEIKESPADPTRMIVRIKLAHSWKGSAKREIFISTAKESSMCGYLFQVGQKYLVYANQNKNDLWVQNCSRTAVFSDKGDANYLSKLKRR